MPRNVCTSPQHTALSPFTTSCLEYINARPRANAGFSNIGRNKIPSVRVFYIHIPDSKWKGEDTFSKRHRPLPLLHAYTCTHQKKKNIWGYKISGCCFFFLCPFRSSNKVFTLRRYLVAHKIIDCEDFSNVFQHLIKMETHTHSFFLGVTFAMILKSLVCWNDFISNVDSQNRWSKINEHEILIEFNILGMNRSKEPIIKRNTKTSLINENSVKNWNLWCGQCANPHKETR